MENELTVIIASKNPVKINAVSSAFEQLFTKQKFSFIGVDVPSNVSDQPMTHQETQEGAYNRAKNAKKLKPAANFWVGIEGGVESSEIGMESFAWIHIVSKEGAGTSKTASFYLPTQVAELVKNGTELGTANDIIFNKENSKQKNGAVGLLTGDLIGRTAYYIEAVILALIPFYNKELYFF